MIKIFKKEFSSKFVLITGVIFLLLSVLSNNFFGNNLTPVSALFDGLGSMGLIILIWGTTEIYISKKITENKILAFILGFFTIGIVLGIIKWLF